MHRQGATTAPSGHHQGLTTAPPGHHQDTTRAPPRHHHQGTTRGQPGHHQGTTRAPPGLHQGATNASPPGREMYTSSFSFFLYPRKWCSSLAVLSLFLSLSLPFYNWVCFSALVVPIQRERERTK